MAKIELADDGLTVQLGFWESLGSLARFKKIEYSKITKITAAEKLDLNILGLRIGGAAIPYVLIYGNYWKNKKWTFAAWKRPQQVLLIEVKDKKFSQYVLGVEDANSWKQQLQLRMK